VRAVRDETPRVRTLALDVPGWPGHRAGQHADVRLTSEDGVIAQRPYSIASAPEDPRVELTVSLLDDGEVSPWLAREARPGDQLELRGPVGSAFSWHVDDGGPLLLVGGGAGLVPLRAMVRHRIARGAATETRVVVSARTRDDLLYAGEHGDWVAAGVELEVTLTRAAARRRVDAGLLSAPSAGARPHVFVCGPTAFAEAAAERLLDLGHAPERVRVERFGGATQVASPQTRSTIWNNR
jgi:ferredoxin-NADP reductase